MRPVPHKERPVTPQRAHKARTQALSRTVSFFLPNLARAKLSQNRPNYKRSSAETIAKQSSF